VIFLLTGTGTEIKPDQLTGAKTETAQRENTGLTGIELE